MAESPSFINKLYDNLSTMNREQVLKLVLYSSIVIGFIIRLVVSVNAWGQKHPDEIYQSLEMAHYIVYGTGYIPPEFQSSHPSYPSYAASRSWLFPMFFAIFMYLGEFLGIDYFTTLVIIKIYMAIHATLLIPAVYKLTLQMSKDTTTSTIAAFMVAFWFRIIEYTVRTFTNTFFLPLIFYGLYKVLHDLEEDDLTFNSLIEIGFLLGISTYIRVDMGIIVFSFFIAYFDRSKMIEYLKIGVSGAMFWIWGAWYDYNMYDGAKFFSVIINWFTFNVINGYSAWFGTTGPLFYIGSLLVADLLVFYLVLIILWPVIDRIRKPSNSVMKSDIGVKFRKSLIATALIWIIYSNLWIIPSFNGIIIPLTHKEPRFIIGGLVVFLISSAFLCRLLLSEVPNWLAKREKQENDTYNLETKDLKRYRNRILGSLLILFLIFSLSATVYREPDDYWEGFNRSLIYIGSENPSPDHIYVAEVWFVTGYYTYSHVSKDTEFHFHSVRYESERSFSIYTLNNAIFDQPLNSYLVLPWFLDQHIDDLYLKLELNNWEMVYEYDYVYVWTLNYN